VYDETQSSTGSISGTWRLALELGDRPASQQAHPYRWGLAESLAAGAEADVTVQLRLERSGQRTLWAAVIHEGTGATQDNVGATAITVTAPDAGPDGGSPDAGNSDGGTHPVTTASTGCTQAGPSPLWLVTAALLFLIRRRRTV
jgi:MYXO-CTERM domain-containing protein